MSDLFDVIEVETAAPHRVRLIAKNKNERSAEAIIGNAVARRGVKNHFYARASAGKYEDGDVVNMSNPDAYF